MKQVYFNPHKGAVNVTRGFSWSAFFFGSLWAMAHRMWVPHVLLMLPLDLAVWFLVGYAEGQGDAMLTLGALGLSIGYAVVRGRHGNAWLAASLRHRGYAEHAPIAAAR